MLHIPIFQTKLGAAIGGPGRNNNPNNNVQRPVEQHQPVQYFFRRPPHDIPPFYVVPPRSFVYLQMPGDRVYRGVLQPLGSHPPPTWVDPPHLPNRSLERVLVRMPNGQSLTAILRSYHDYHNHAVDRYRCFVQIRNSTLLVAHLHTHNNENYINTRTRVYVRMPEYNNTIYMAMLRPGEIYRPAWLHREIGY